MNALPNNPADIETPAEEQQFTAANNAYTALTANQKTWLASQTQQKLSQLTGLFIVDNNSLPALNLKTPLHTDFISSAGAQQHNPHMQLRAIDGKPELVDTQIGLVRTLAINPNAPVVVDAAVLSANYKLEYRTPHSGATKMSSAGSTLISTEEMTGLKNNYSPVATSLDDDIAKAYAAKESAAEAYKAADTKLTEAQENKTTAYNALQAALATSKYQEANSTYQAASKNQDTAVTERAKAYDDLAKAESEYQGDWNTRLHLEEGVKATMNQLAYLKKDKNGLVFDKAFDGVYIIRFVDGTQLVLHDPAAAGWTYQTFAHYVDPVNGVIHGYQSIGDATTNMPTTGTATYKGLTTAYLTNNGGADRQMTANVTAVADFAKRGLRFSTDNSQFHTLDVNGKRVSTAAADYNLRGNAKWAEGGNSFNGDIATVNKNMNGSLNGKFFGDAAAEIGGTYGLKSKDGQAQLIGGYGAKRP